jgi:hypothetical protein
LRPFLRRFAAEVADFLHFSGASALKPLRLREILRSYETARAPIRNHDFAEVRSAARNAALKIYPGQRKGEAK